MAEKSTKKRSFWTNIVVLALCLFLCACQKTDYLPMLDGTFSCRAEGTLGGEPFAAAVTVGETGVLRVTFTAPKKLEGITAVWENESYRLLFEGVEIENSRLSGFLLPARLLADAFTVTNVKADKTKTVVVGANERGTREVTVNGEGKIVLVKGTYDGIYAEFEVEFSH